MQRHAMKANQIGSYKGKAMTALGTDITLHCHVWDVTKQRLHHVPANGMSDCVSSNNAYIKAADHGSRRAKKVTMSNHTSMYARQGRHACMHVGVTVSVHKQIPT